jgi:DNA (cytosine-5)-methyltransferase 1
MSNKLVVVELFAGIGGFSRGIEEAYKELTGSTEGLEFWANDIDPYACAIYRYNFVRRSKTDGVEDEGERGERGRDKAGHGIELPDGSADGRNDNQDPKIPRAALYEGDLQAIDPASIPDADVITFGWPCQDNSVSGKRAGQKEGTRSGLLFEAVRILRAKKPKYFLAENVPGLFSVNDGRDFYTAIRMFTDAGYDVQWQILDTRQFLPQNRKRIIFVGHLIGNRRPEVFPIGEATADDNEPIQASE